MRERRRSADPERPAPEEHPAGVSRRELLKNGTAAALGGASLLAGEALAVQAVAPALQRGTSTGRPFRARAFSMTTTR